MSGPVVLTARYGAEEICIEPAQVLRYLGISGKRIDRAAFQMAQQSIDELKETVDYQVCWMTTEIAAREDAVDFGVFYAPGRSIAKNLQGCRQAILFAATTGMRAEQQRRRAEALSMAKAVMLGAAGTAAVEALCDRFCTDRQNELNKQHLRPRFSPGYGDLPLQLQKSLLNCLDSHRKIGLSLTESMMMVPQKSVTAIVGIGAEGCTTGKSNCENCDKRDCTFRL